jgi:hypothetical protein
VRPGYRVCITPCKIVAVFAGMQQIAQNATPRIIAVLNDVIVEGVIHIVNHNAGDVMSNA